MRFATVFVLLSLFSSFLRAQSPLDPQPSPQLQQAIVVTASRVPESVESTPAAVTIITRKDLEKRATRDVADALREVPGLIISRTGSSGKATSIFTRGGSSKDTLVLWNGVEINNPFFAGYNFGTFSTAGVDRIEIVRGPFSALYGSDAVSGVVNILADDKSNRLDADLAAGENGLAHGNLSGSFTSGAWNGGASLGYRQDDGFANNDDFEHNSATAGIHWNGHPDLSIGLRTRYSSYDLGVPFNVNAAGTAFEPTPHRREAGNELQIALPVHARVGPVSLDLTLSTSNRNDDAQDPNDPFGRLFASTESTTRRGHLTAQGATRLGTLIAGLEYEIATVDDISSYGTNISNRERTGKSLFVENRFTLNTGNGTRLEAVAGLRHDDFETFGTELSPRLAAAWVAGQNKIRAAYGHGFRAPAVGELYFPFFGNPDLAAERSRSSEFGYDRFIGRHSIVSMTLFRTKFDDLIVYDTVSQTFQNIGKALSEGIEVGASGETASGLSAGLTYTYLDTEENETNSSLLRRPRHSGSLSAGYGRGPWAAHLVVTHNGSRADLTDLFPYDRVTNDAYTVADVALQRSFERVTPYVKLENLSDETYQEVFGYPSPGRRAVIGVRFSSERSRP